MDVDGPRIDAGQCDGWVDDNTEETAILGSTLPPGEEEMSHSHAGGATIFQQIMDDIHIQ